MNQNEHRHETPASYEDFMARKYMRPIRPYTMHFEVTNRCNLRCIHCLLDKEQGEELSLSEVLRILQELEQAGVFSLALSGGELLMREDIGEIFAFLHEHRFLLTIYTNGTLLSEHLIGQVAGLRPQSVEVSVYGADDQVHDRVTRVPGSFRRTIGSIEKLKTAGVEVIFKGFLLQANFHQRRGMIALAESLEIKRAFDFNLIPKVTGNTDNLAAGLTVEQLRTVYREVAEEGVILRNNAQIVVQDGQLPLGGRVVCNAGLINGCVSSRGEVYPCPVLRLAMGSLRKQSLQDIWMTSTIDAIRFMKLDDLKECKSCSVLPYCSRCPGAAYLETGDFLGPAPAAVCGKYRALCNS
ncbi:MAG: radical SAM protein [Desulfobacteraceae bacterium]|nr:MAG: radical SAM protein [Desulfobacteraceae bacterium]